MLSWEIWTWGPLSDGCRATVILGWLVSFNSKQKMGDANVILWPSASLPVDEDLR